ncbi:MAG: Asp-tRNA(Asn)/Glu-tRNA(Gln) amidotransferase subunit GatC [Desulfovibrionaceae bacterium]|nr:Asp-tRNA(Asn)/Glu-tRNA(Gln) amidotransferase subunit GatC [Desulfovibrionaceae bacterium]
MPTQSVSVADVTTMAQLARLDVPEEHKEQLARQFGDILAYMDVLSSIDTSTVEPLYSPVLHKAAPRPDIAVNTRQREAMLHNSPAQNSEYFTVPRIV